MPWMCWAGRWKKLHAENEKAAIFAAFLCVKVACSNPVPGVLRPMRLLGCIRHFRGLVLSLVHRLDDDLGHVGRTRLLRHMTGLDFGDLRFQFLGKRTLQIRLDHAVVASNDVPGRFAFPGSDAGFVVECRGTNRSLRGGHDGGLCGGKILGEAGGHAWGVM